jgi:hypothetical protein
MTYGFVEDLKFAIEVFDVGGNLTEVLARLHDLDAARAAYDACRTKYPMKMLYLSQGGRILRRSDRDDLGRPRWGGVKPSHLFYTLLMWKKGAPTKIPQ